MEFDEKTHKVKWEFLNKDEARAFLMFLESEKLRHQEDIDEITNLVQQVKSWYNIQYNPKGGGNERFMFDR